MEDARRTVAVDAADERLDQPDPPLLLCLSVQGEVEDARRAVAVDAADERLDQPDLPRLGLAGRLRQYYIYSYSYSYVT